MPPEIRADQIDRLIDDAVEQAEESVTYVPEGYGPSNARGITFGRGKRAADDDEDD